MLWNNEIVFKVKHDRHNNYFVDARTRGRVRGKIDDDDYQIVHFRNITLHNLKNRLSVAACTLEII